MSHHSYWSYAADDAHKQGHRDVINGRFSNFDFDRMRDNETDRAYFEGREDERRAEERRQEDRDRERQEEERAHQRDLERQREEQAQEDYYYQQALEAQQEKEQNE